MEKIATVWTVKFVLNSSCQKISIPCSGQKFTGVVDHFQDNTKFNTNLTVQEVGIYIELGPGVDSR